ncbi:MAG: hypothetical protein IAA89_05680 [Firmicutes bacterium]|uniref:Surface layer protein A domain-containing protein n=1 Tax=Candidatus Gallilactobacillus intestinavium TaxID=2840838 RepID=A0A9D9HA22_9LACO|nr:hypothetical protein [Candidatus Gallilactobacillus intestinavium]
MKKKVLSYVALSSALLTAAPLLGNVTANAATTNNNTTSSSAKVSSSSSSAKESNKVSATSSSKAADKKAAHSAVRANNFAEVATNNNQAKQNLSVKPTDVQYMIDQSKNTKISNMTSDDQSNLIHAVDTNTTVVPNVYGQGFSLIHGIGGAGGEALIYNGQAFTGYDAQDGVFWYEGTPYTLAALEKAGIKVPQNIINAMKQAEANKANAKSNNGNVRLTNNGIRTYGYSHYVANVNAKTLPKTGESNSIISLLKALF